MKRKKIVLVYDMLKELGGLERMMFMYANCLHRQGYEVELVFGYVDEKESKRITEELGLDKSIKIRQLGNSKDYKIQLASFLLNSRGLNCDHTDLVISFGFMSSKNAYHERLLKGTPYIVVLCHPPNFLYPAPGNWVNNPIRLAAKMLGIFVGGILRKKDKTYVRTANKLITISKYTDDRIQDIYGYRHYMAGIDTKIIYPAISDSFRLMSEKEMDDFKKKKGIKERYILAHGRIIPDKNYHIIISMLDRLDCNLIITGGIDEKYKKFLENAIEKEELATGVVNIVGRVSNEDLVGYYNCASVFVNPAFKEDFGLTPPEAMACGCPVVAWDDGAGPSETVINGKTGILVSGDEEESFKEGIRQALRKKWDRKAIHNSIKRFSHGEIEKQIIKEVKL